MEEEIQCKNAIASLRRDCVRNQRHIDDWKGVVADYQYKVNDPSTSDWLRAHHEETLQSSKRWVRHFEEENLSLEERLQEQLALLSHLTQRRPDILEAEIPPIPHTPLIPLPKEDWESFMTTDSTICESRPVGRASPEPSSPEERTRYRKAYELAIRTQATVKLLAVRLNHIGLPRSGKTSFLRRLVGEIENIWKARLNGEVEQPSTGVAEEGGQVLIKTSVSSTLSVIQSKVWSLLKNLGEEADLIGQFFYQVTDSVSAPPQAAPTCPGTTSDSNETRPISIDKEMEELYTFLKQASDESGWEEVKFVLDNLILLINTDTGGQAEFLDLQAALVQGPSFNLLYSRLVDELDSQFKMYYTNKEGVSTGKEDSIKTVLEVMFQSLSTIACCSGCEELKTGAPCPVQKSLRPAKSKVMIVGTYRDQVSDTEFKRKDQLLQQKIKNTEFFNKGIVEFATKDQLMISVDNMTGSREEIEENRKILERVIERSFEKVNIPVTWLMLSLYIRKKNVRTMSLSDCEELAGKMGINPSELQNALWFLHHCIGVLLYYPEVEALKDTVICQMQVVYDSTSNLIKNVFTFERVGKMACERFQEKAQFTLADVKKAMSGHSDDLIPPEKLVKLLEHRNILTVLPSTLTPGSQGKHSHEPTLFMPSVLQCARASDLSVLTTNSDSDPAPLMLRYECGYTPVGVFPAMITNLVSQQLDDWEMIEEGLRKNKVQFHVGKDCDVITLIAHPQYFEIVISRSNRFQTPPESLCAHVRSVIEFVLETVSFRMNYHFDMRYKFGFECPAHPGREHLCVLSSVSARKMKCLQNVKCKQVIPLEERHRVWFADAGSKSTATYYSTPDESLTLTGKPKLHQLLSLKVRDKECKLVQTVGVDWMQLGLALEFEYNLLRAIEKDNHGRTHESCNELLNRWLDGEACRPVTWGRLIEALGDAGHSTLAAQLHQSLTL